MSGRVEAAGRAAVAAHRDLRQRAGPGCVHGGLGEVPEADLADPDGAVVREYDVTFQTACNWFNGERVPTGDKIGHAFTLYGAEARQLLTGV